MSAASPAGFGIIGDFPGDEELFNELKWCCEAFQSRDRSKPPLARLVSLLGALPHSGRVAVVRNFIRTSPHRDAILRDLFDYCFDPSNEEDVEGEEDVVMLDEDDDLEDDVEEFVLIANPRQENQENLKDDPPKPLNLNKLHIFQAVIILMAVSESAGAEMSRRYLRMASTKFQAKILIQCATCFTDEQFPDHELWRNYQDSPGSVRTAIVDACKRSRKRKDLLRRVYESGMTDGVPEDPDLVYWLEGEYLASTLDRLSDQDKKNSFKLKRWGVYGDDVYIPYIRREMQAVKNDQLKLGSTWRSLLGRMECNSVLPKHVSAVMNILEEYKPLEMHFSHSQKDAQEYVQSLSANGEDVSGFDGIHRVRMDPILLKILPKQERLKLAIEYIGTRDWNAFKTVQHLVPRFKLPYQEFYTKSVSKQAFYSWLVRKDPDAFVDFFLSDDLFSKAASDREKSKILRLNANLHLQFKPSDLSEQELAMYCPGDSRKQLWTKWYKSYTRFYISENLRHFRNKTCEVLAAESELPTNLAFRLESCCAFALEVLDVAAQGMIEVRSACHDLEVAMEPLLEVCMALPVGVLVDSPTQLAKNVAERVQMAIIEHVIPSLDRSMQFDPAAEDAYINWKRLSFYKSTMGKVIIRWHFSEEVVRCISLSLLDVLARATRRQQHDGKETFAVISSEPPKKKQRFAFFDFELHRQTSEGVLRLIKEVLQVVRDSASSGGEIIPRLWELVKQETQKEDTGQEYLSACERYLPGFMFDEEKAVIVDRSRQAIVKAIESSPGRWRQATSEVAQRLVRLGLLETILEDESISPQAQKLLLVNNAGFRNEVARQSLKDATYVSDGDSRAEGLKTWLSEAFKTESVDLIAEALSFATSRLKNESGIHRRTVFPRIMTEFATSVVKVSLEDEIHPAGVHKRLSSAILAIQKNDLSRLDSVGRQVCFPRLPTLILETVLRHDPVHLCLGRRQMWADCAIRLSWEYAAAVGGNEKLQCYAWPLLSGEPAALESASWVPMVSFAAVYLGSSKPSSIDKVSRICNRVGARGLLNRLREEFDRDKVFGPRQCVEILVHSLDAVWDDSLPVSALPRDGSFGDNDEAAMASRKRLEDLLNLCGTAWQEVGLLVDIYDKVFSSIETCSIEHFQHASEILDVLFEIHKRGAYQVPRLARACDSLFRRAVSAGFVSHANHWMSRWMSLYLVRNERIWDFPVDDRLLPFLEKFGDGCEPDAWRKVLTKNDQIARECKMARDLLAMTPSALLITEIRTIIFSRRQDIALRLVNGVDSLQGVFMDPKTDYSSLDELLFHTIEKEWLLSCNSRVSQKYAKFASTKATNREDNLESRVDAIVHFMDAPSTQHEDVLSALQSDLEDAVREALINRVLTLDAPWHILGYLLGQKGLKKNDQRITSSLLGYVARHVHVDKVVKVVGLLLSPRRRNSLSFQLHKGVVRMLFDAKTPESMSLLREEWEHDLPNDVRTLIVGKCIGAVANGNLDGWESWVLTQVATQPYELELKFGLFAPYWKESHGLSMFKVDGVATDEVVDQFRQKRPTPVLAQTWPAVEKFRSILKQLEDSADGSLRFLAKLMRLSFSNCFAPEPQNYQEDLNEMALFLSNLSMELDHKAQIGLDYISILFAAGVCRILTYSLPENHKFNTEELSKFFDGNDAVSLLRDCVRSLLGVALDVPIRQQNQRRVFLSTLGRLMETVRQNSRHSHLLVKPFEEELKLLREDVASVRTALVYFWP